MNVFLQLPFVAGFFSLLLAIFSVVRKKPSAATWCFFAGMAALGADSIFTGLSLRATRLTDVDFWTTAASVVKCFIPVIWLGFSLTYSRSGYREFLLRWRVALAVIGLLPITLWLVFRDEPLRVATIFNSILLVALVLIVMNLELTFRAAVGTMRWRIKYVILATIVIFGARIYGRSQAILYSAPDISLWGIESGALLIGCLFLSLAYARTGWNEVDVHPSSAVLRSSLTVILVGGYLFIVGVLAVVVRRFGGAEFFQLQAFVVLLGIAGLAVLLLSDRGRQKIDQFVARHFKKAQHDSVRIWTAVSHSLASVTNQAMLCTVSAKLISQTFDALSVTVWLVDEETGQLVLSDSTSRSRTSADTSDSADRPSTVVVDGLTGRSTPFDLESVTEAWGAEFQHLNPATFPHGGNRLCVPLRAGTRTVGAVVVADRIGARTYTVEELELLKCIGDQITSVLLNIRLAGEVAAAQELEAFRTMSAFFVHDLKNAAASLNLTLKNLPVHFEDPAFRQDALRAVGNTAQKIDDMIARLSALRQRPESARVETDLNALVTSTVESVGKTTGLEVLSQLQPVPLLLADREQLESVVTNLVLNARDAVGSNGRIEVRTEHRAGRVVLSVADNGCGMSAAFIKDALFRPFQSTKKKGLGLGLYQSRSIVLAHGGTMHVESEIGKGTSIHASFPVGAR